MGNAPSRAEVLKFMIYFFFSPFVHSVDWAPANLLARLRGEVGAAGTSTEEGAGGVGGPPCGSGSGGSSPGQGCGPSGTDCRPLRWVGRPRPRLRTIPLTSG